MNEIEFIKNMQTMEIRENDILVVKLDRVVTPKTIGEVTNLVKSNLPDSVKEVVKVFVFGPDVDIGILRKQFESEGDTTVI